MNCLGDNHLRQNFSSQKNCRACNGQHHSTLSEPLKQVKPSPETFSTGSVPFTPSRHSSNEVSPNQNKQKLCRYGKSFGKTKKSNTQMIDLDSRSNNQSLCLKKSRLLKRHA